MSHARSRAWPVLLVACALAAGCGGDESGDDGPRSSEVVTGPGDAKQKPSTQRAHKATPAGFADCIRTIEGVRGVRVEGPESEDAKVFAPYVDGPVNVVTFKALGDDFVSGVYLFAGVPDAGAARPRISAEGLGPVPWGRAVILTTADHAVKDLKACLDETGYGPGDLGPSPAKPAESSDEGLEVLAPSDRFTVDDLIGCFGGKGYGWDTATLKDAGFEGEAGAQKGATVNVRDEDSDALIGEVNVLPDHAAAVRFARIVLGQVEDGVYGSKDTPDLVVTGNLFLDRGALDEEDPSGTTTGAAIVEKCGIKLQ